jgi:hypothetical protein
MQHNSLHPELVCSQNDKTPKETFIGVKPKLSHFCIFSCLILVEKRTKLEPSSMKGLFVGYSETSKAYRVYILE